MDDESGEPEGLIGEPRSAVQIAGSDIRHFRPPEGGSENPVCNCNSEFLWSLGDSNATKADPQKGWQISTYKGSGRMCRPVRSREQRPFRSFVCTPGGT